MIRARAFINKISAKTAAAFLLTLSLCALLVSFSIANRMRVERLTMERLIMEKIMKANEALSRLFYKTKTLAALVIQNNGEITDFDRIAASIIDDPAILNVLAAPGGVVTNVYPLAGNEAVMGLNFFGEGAGNKEAIQAKETGRFVFGGPFTSVQGSQILVGRLPVFLPGAGLPDDFWGLVSVTLKYPQALDGSGLSELQIQGFAYEIWRVNPDDGLKQIIAGSDYGYNENKKYIEKEITIQDTVWYFRILPVRAWYEYPDAWLLIFLGMCISILVAFVMQNNSELRELKNRFESLSNTDKLTGTYNRRYLEENMSRLTQSLSHSGGYLSVIMLDIDFFKEYNDTYGHSVGDVCLKAVSEVFVNTVGGDGCFVARYGGEEFVVILPGINPEAACVIAGELLRGVEARGIPHSTSSVADCVTVSAGVASGKVNHAQDGNEYIKRADEALYISKGNGRNRCTFLAMPTV